MESNFINITDAFKAFADGHKQIKSYDFGDISNLNTSGAIYYIGMWVAPDGCQARGGEVGFSFTITMMDIVKKDKSNLIDVLNDTNRVMLDLLAHLKINGDDAVNGSLKFQLKQNEVPEMQSFYDDRYDDELSGWTQNVTLWVSWDWNECNIPN